ncbi:MAG: ATP-binding protein [Anaerolineae bacterium]|jgi:PAS domain S-box-containing protein
MPPAQTKHERTLRVLNEAAVALQQARTPEEVYEAVGNEMHSLGYRTIFLRLTRDGRYLRVEKLSVPADILAVTEEATGLGADTYQIPIDTLPDYKEVLTKRATVFVPALTPVVVQSLPPRVSSTATKIVNSLGLHKGIVGPLIVAGQVQGVLVVSAEEIDQDDVPVVAVFAAQVSAALERARLFEELQEREWRANVAYEMAQQYAQEMKEKVEEEQHRLREITALNTVAAVTAEELVADRVMERGLVAMQTVFQLDGAAIYYLDDQQVLHLASAQGNLQRSATWRATGLPHLHDLEGSEEILAGQPVLLANPGLSGEPVRAVVHDPNAQTVAYLPLRAGGRLIGLMVLNATRADILTQNDLKLLTSIASQFATSLENARLFEQEQERRAKLDRLNKALRRFAGQLQHCQDEISIAKLLCDVVTHALHWNSVVVALQDGLSMAWYPVAQVGYARLQISLLPTPHGPAPWMQEQFRVSHSYYVPDISAARFNDTPSPALFQTAGELSYLLAIPLEAGGQTLGMLLPSGRADRSSPTPQDIERLELFASQAAIAIESIRLSRSVRMWANAVRHSGDAIYITDIEGQIINVNPAFEALTGYQREEIVGKNMSVLNSGLTPPAIYEAMWETVLGNKPWRGEVIHQRADGSVYDADLTVAPILDQEGRIVRVVGSQRDISRIKELDRLKTQFVSNVSHELRTPLTNIKLYQGYLRNGRRPDLQQRFFDILDRETNRLIQIIEGLLDLSLLDAKRLPLHPISLNWNDLIGDIVANYREQAIEHGLALTFQATEEPLYVLADRVHISQVLINLLANALNYTPAGGQIKVTTHATDGMAVVTIQDTGYGIAPDEAEQIFDRFFRGQAARRSRSAGTGLGLSIVKQLLELYDGTVEVTSAIDEGSTFTVSLPAVPATAVSLEVLLVADSALPHHPVHDHLEAAGYQVTAVQDKQGLLDYTAQQMPDLIVLDLSLPRIAALEILERLREEVDGAPPPVLVISNADPDLAHKAADIGANEFLSRPYSPQVFLDVVDRLLQGVERR